MTRIHCPPLSVLTSWLDAVAIPHGPATHPGAALAVQRKEHPSALPVVLLFGGQVSPVVPVPHVSVLGSALLDADLKVAMEAFHSVTSAAGYGKPMPRFRGERPAQRVKDSDLAVLRHRNLYRAPNPNDALLRDYEQNVLKNMAGEFQRTWRGLLETMLVDRDDLMSMMRVWTVAFLHEGRSPYASAETNRRLLATNLRQRFSEFVRHLKRQRALQQPSYDDYLLATTGGLKEEREAYDHDSEQGHIEDLVDLDRSERKHLSAADRKLLKMALGLKRNSLVHRSEAPARLDDQLACLPHDEMVYLLTEAAESEHIAPEARLLAARRLEEHRKTCAACPASSDVNE